MTDAEDLKSLPVVSFDESGNSGQNLLDAAQPIFVLCSLDVAESVARDIVDRHRGESEELKFSSLRKSPAGQSVVQAVIDEEAITPDTVFLSMALKPWMIAGKFVDLLVEPYFYARGLNMYAAGLPLAMANALYERGGQAMGEEVWRALQAALVKMMMKPTEVNRSAMLETLASARKACSPEESGIAAMLDAALALPDVTEEVHADKVSYQLDPAPAALTVHIDHWSTSIGPHRIAHDHSAAVSEWQPYLEKLADPSIEPTEIDYGNSLGRLPLQFRTIEMVDSKENPAVQLADVLAGALAALALQEFGARRPQPFVTSLGEGKLPSLVKWWSPPRSPYWLSGRKAR
jgi:Protein of unknown function (DUF3800)